MKNGNGWWRSVAASVVTAALIGAGGLIFGTYFADRQALHAHELAMERFEVRLKILESRTDFPMQPHMAERITEIRQELREIEKRLDSIDKALSRAIGPPMPYGE